jgi:DNA-binding MarR family transcriptional regulator
MAFQTTVRIFELIAPYSKTQKEIYETLGISPNTAQKILKKLVELEYVYIYEQKKFPFKKSYNLTSKGYKKLENLKEAKNLIGDLLELN